MGVQKSGNNSINVEGQAAKRQKLEGGLLCKVTNTKQQANFIHKAPKKEGGMDSKLHIIVPRPPDLATSQRAQRSQRIRLIRSESNTAGRRSWILSFGLGYTNRPYYLISYSKMYGTTLHVPHVVNQHTKNVMDGFVFPMVPLMCVKCIGFIPTFS
uniref:Uncharacterized protein n=1 Tax=Lactuca sativa TaxID=4236 RepID=A0A9R1VJB5_LACSA|nr:hypothetical protein LSAT_V11C500245280 [Lactuca sativa]